MREPGDADPVIASVLALVEWQDASVAAHRARHARFTDAVTRGLGQLLGIARRADLASGRALEAALAASDDDAYLAVLASPVVAEALLWRPDLEPAAQVELVLGAVRAPVTGPRLAAGAVLDLTSADRFRGDGLDDGTPQPWPSLDADAADALRARLDRAWGIVADTAPAAAALVASSLRTVSIRTSDHAGFGSSSTLTFPGRVTLINPWLPHVDDVLLAESLVHEAIHAFIYELEVEHFWAEQAPIKVASPWSGNPIPLHAYAHACFVWFGLWRWWHAALAHPTLAERVVPRLERAAVGFVKGEASRRLEPHRGRLRPGLIEACEHMAARVRADLGYADAA